MERVPVSVFFFVCKGGVNSVWVTFTADWCPLVESLILQQDGDVVMGNGLLLYEDIDWRY